MSKRAQWDPADYPVRDWTQSPEQGTWRQETSRRFHDLMDNAMMVSFRKYGAVADGFPEKVNAIDSLQIRLKLYLEGRRNPDYGEPGEGEWDIAPGNVEYLVDAANFAMIEFMHPAHPDAILIHTDASGSPGRAHRNAAIYGEKPNGIDNLGLATPDERPEELPTSREILKAGQDLNRWGGRQM